MFTITLKIITLLIITVTLIIMIIIMTEIITILGVCNLTSLAVHLSYTINRFNMTKTKYNNNNTHLLTVTAGNSRFMDPRY